MKRAAALRLRKYREQQGAFLVEGADPVIAGILSGARPQVVFVLAGGAVARSLEDGAGTGADDIAGVLAGVHVQPVTERVARKISTLDTPPDVMAVFGTPTPPPLASLATARSLVLYVDHVADPGNLGTLLRSALAFGVTALATSPGCVDPLSPKVVRAGMGAVFGLPVYGEARVVEISRDLGGATVYGLAAHGGTDLRALVPRLPAVICVGAERAGLSSEVAALCDELVTIPLPGVVPGDSNEAAGSVRAVDETGDSSGGSAAAAVTGGGSAVESLNAGVAGSIALYELSRRTAGGTKR